MAQSGEETKPVRGFFRIFAFLGFWITLGVLGGVLVYHDYTQRTDWYQTAWEAICVITSGLTEQVRQYSVLIIQEAYELLGHFDVLLEEHSVPWHAILTIVIPMASVLLVLRFYRKVRRYRAPRRTESGAKIISSTAMEEEKKSLQAQAEKDSEKRNVRWKIFKKWLRWAQEKGTTWSRNAKDRLPSKPNVSTYMNNSSAQVTILGIVAVIGTLIYLLSGSAPQKQISQVIHSPNGNSGGFMLSLIDITTQIFGGILVCLVRLLAWEMTLEWKWMLLSIIGTIGSIVLGSLLLIYLTVSVCKRIFNSLLSLLRRLAVNISFQQKQEAERTDYIGSLVVADCDITATSGQGIIHGPNGKQFFSFCVVEPGKKPVLYKQTGVVVKKAKFGYIIEAIEEAGVINQKEGANG